MEEREAERWSFGRRLLFCFAFVYLVLYWIPFPLDMLPGGEHVWNAWFSIWQRVVPLAGESLFGVKITVEPNGSGDTTFNYVQVFCFLVIAAVVALIWAIADRRRTSYARLHEWLRIYVRFSLATAMFAYGIYKVMPTQFPEPGLGRLMQSFGDASPMGLLWTFMGASRSYSIFAGLSEIVGGFLLTMRRTTLLGALLSAGVLANIVVLNFSYDVPVKLYSMHLLAMAVFLMLPDLGRLSRFFLLNRPVEPAVFPKQKWGVILFRTAFVALAIYVPLKSSIEREARREARRLPIHGVWQVEEFAPPLAERSRWRRVVLDRVEMGVHFSSDERIRYALDLDEKKHELGLTRLGNPSKQFRLHYTQTAQDRLVIDGSFEGENVRASLRRVPTAGQFLLLDRDFRWISEYPFNR